MSRWLRWSAHIRLVQTQFWTYTSLVALGKMICCAQIVIYWSLNTGLFNIKRSVYCCKLKCSALTWWAHITRQYGSIYSNISFISVPMYCYFGSFLMHRQIAVYTLRVRVFLHTMFGYMTTQVVSVNEKQVCGTCICPMHAIWDPIIHTSNVTSCHRCAKQKLRAG